MFFNSFSRSIGRVVIFTAVGLAVATAALKVFEWSPALIAAGSQILGL